MEHDNIQELLRTRALVDKELANMRTPITILFSDIKGSTPYFETKGDVEGLAMIQRHNKLLIPLIEGFGGRVVKTIGDAIMACFEDPVAAIRAAIGMQQALEDDSVGRRDEDRIHIRVGLHTGLGLVKDNDVYGDVVNAASRVQHQAQPGQILITDVLIPAAKAAGVPFAKMGRAEMKGKDEPIDLYAVAWSTFASEQLVDELQVQYDRKLKDAAHRLEELEDEFEHARDSWRSERRRMVTEIEELEESMGQVRENAKREIAEDLQSEAKFQLEEALAARHVAEEQLAADRSKWERDRDGLKATIASMQGAVIEAMERSNNPSRFALAVREQLDARVKEAKKEWDIQWDSERRMMSGEIERLKKANGSDERKEVARRALLEKLGKLPAGSAPRPTTVDQISGEFRDAKARWEVERDQLKLKIERLEKEIQAGTDEVRRRAYDEVRAQYEPRLAEEGRELQRLEQELATVRAQLEDERRQTSERVSQLEQTIPQAQEAARRQLAAELKVEFDEKAEELNRLRARTERRLQDEADEAEAERRRLRKQIAQLEEQLKDAKGTAYIARKLSAQAGRE